MRFLSSLVVRLSLLSAVVGLLTGGGLLVAIDQVTASRMIALLDADLQTQAREWETYRQHVRITDAPSLRAAAADWLSQQRDHPESQLQLVQLGERDVVANHTTLEGAAARPAPISGPVGPGSPGGAVWLFHAPDGFAVATDDGVEHLRVLSVPVMSGAQRLGTLRIGDSLVPVGRAREAIRHQFLEIGLPITLLGALLVAYSTHRLVRPLAHVSRVAGLAETGELSARSGVHRGAAEIVSVSGALDDMLDRVEAGIASQRRFIANASHELKTPLTILRTEAEMVERFGMTPDAGALVRQVDSMTRLVNDLTLLAVADEDAQTLVRLEDVDLAGYCADLRRDLPLLGDRTFRVECARGTVPLDPHRLDQVLRNLVSNAVRYTQPGDVISVRFTPVDDVLEIVVSDTGDGMTPEQASRAFERLQHGDRRDNTGGTGLGLPICRALVTAHGGTIALASEPGVGTTVTIRLPHYTPEDTGSGHPDAPAAD